MKLTVKELINLGLQHHEYLIIENKKKVEKNKVCWIEVRLSLNFFVT